MICILKRTRVSQPVELDVNDVSDNYVLRLLSRLIWTYRLTMFSNEYFLELDFEVL